MPIYSLGYHSASSCLDTLSIEPSGVFQILGWSRCADQEALRAPQCFVEGQELTCLQRFRTYRPDVATALRSQNPFHGVGFVYRVPSTLAGPKRQLIIRSQGKVCFRKAVAVPAIEPGYALFLDTPTVLHREQLYASGPPVPVILEEIVALAKTLPPPILDFGCGTGILIRHLRAAGLEAYGIEIHRPAIREALLPDVRSFVTLYDGHLPLPFADQAFRSVIASEVLEHIQNYTETLSELARVASEQLLITVPDMSAIPLCYHSHVVPWHILEGTHVNFFNQTSLIQTLEPYFHQVSTMRIAPTTTNGYTWWGNIAMICQR
jgi:SAM-dependent methyltransferase